MIDGVGGGKKSGEKIFLTWQKIGKRGRKVWRRKTSERSELGKN